QHVDNELTVRKNLLVTLNDDLASGGRVHVVGTEHELQRLSVTRLDQSQREGGAKLGLDGADLLPAPSPNLLGRPLRGLNNTIGGHVADRHVGRVIRPRVSRGSLGAVRRDEQPTRHVKIRLANGNVLTGRTSHCYS